MGDINISVTLTQTYFKDKAGSDKAAHISTH